jgi:hypothetical protein
VKLGRLLSAPKIFYWGMSANETFFDTLVLLSEMENDECKIPGICVFNSSNTRYEIMLLKKLTKL